MIGISILASFEILIVVAVISKISPGFTVLAERTSWLLSPHRVFQLPSMSILIIHSETGE